MFTSELTLTNRGARQAEVEFSYTAALGSGNGQAKIQLAGGRQLVAPDAIAYLKSLGIPIAGTSGVGGTLAVRFSGLSSRADAMATVRTTTSTSEGRAGLAYPGIPIYSALQGAAYLCGLRQNLTDRSNVAVQNAGAAGDGDVTLRLTVISGDPNLPGSFTLPDEVLSPGGFKQINAVLTSQGVGYTNGYVRVERVSGSAPYYAYAVINDQANSDGSFVLPVAAADLPVAELTLPVIVETDIFESELTLTNFGTQPKTLRLNFVASSIQTPGNTAQTAFNLLPGEQKIIPSFVQYLKSRGVPGLTSAPSHAGALFVTADGGNVAGIFAGARTSALGGGGRYGLFYSAVPRGAAISTSCWLNGLQQNAENRTNLALVNTGDKDTNADVFSIEIYNGLTGQKVNSVASVTLGARRWLQLGSILAQYAPGVAQAYTRITRTSGANSFLAYAVINDGGSAGQRSGDGAYLLAASAAIPGLNSMPIANAGPDQSALRNTRVTLDGSGSSDDDGDALAFRWTIQSSPTGSTTAISDAATSRPSFIPDLPGNYVLSLVVNDGKVDSPADTVSIAVTTAPPTANAGADKNVYEETTVTLDGTGSRSPTGGVLSYRWELKAKPPGSVATLSNTSTANPTFTADLEGEYRASLIVSDGFAESAEDAVVITVYRTFARLSYRPIDAEYSSHLEALVLVSTAPNALHVYDPATGVDKSVALPLTPSSVSVSPDGRFAAVGHNALISYVDLVNGLLAKTLPVTTDVLDIVLAGNGYVYAFPRRDQWENIRCIQLASGAETLSTGVPIYAGTLGKLHPNGKSIYAANNGLSPSDIEKLDISQGTATSLYDSPYHGDYAMCGDLWISEDGNRIFTRCANVFRSSDVQSQDMTYNGALSEMSLIQSMSHSALTNKIVSIPQNTPPFSQGYKGQDTELHFYDYEFLAFEKKLQLPGFIVNGRSFAGHGRFVFQHTSGSKQFVVIQADPTSGLLNDFGVVTYGSRKSAANIPPVANAGQDRLVLVGNQVVLDGTASSDFDGTALQYTWTLMSKPSGSSAALSDSAAAKPSFGADLEGVYRISLVVSDGQESSPVDTITVTANRLIGGLTYRVVDAEYSKALERIVMVSGSPNQLHIYDPLTGAETTVKLPLPPSCVSVSPDGRFAAVGHNAVISYVDLGSASLLKTLPVTTDVLDIVLAGNGYVYAFPRRDQWQLIRCIHIATGAETLSTGGQIYAGTLGKLHPNGKSIYAANNGLSPSDIEKLDISQGTATRLYDSPYHGDYAMCGDLWISEDGNRIFTRCANVFRSSDVQSQDMTYNGALSEVRTTEGTWVQHLVHSLPAGKVAVIPGVSFFQNDDNNRDTELQIYGYEFLSFERRVALPPFPVGTQSFAGHGRFVFFNSAGNKKFVVVQADEKSALLNDYGVAEVD